MSLRLGETAETLPPSVAMQLNNIVIDYNYRFSQNKSEYVFIQQRVKDPKIPKLYSNRETGINVYKDLNTSLIYRNSEQLPGSVSREFFPEWKWEPEPEGSTVILGYTCRKASSTDASGQILTVWYAPDIAVPDGPVTYGGLRGLILQVESDDFIIKAGNVTVDPENKTDIQMPQAGEYLTKGEFDALKRK